MNHLENKKYCLYTYKSLYKLHLCLNLNFVKEYNLIASLITAILLLDN